MSKQVPQDRPLSDEDRLYLLKRGRESSIEYLDQQFPPDPAELAAFNARLQGGPDLTGDLGAYRVLEARVAELERYITEDLGAALPGIVESEEDDRPYTAWLLSELQEEAGNRHLSKTGTKAEIAERLSAHDAAQQ